MGKKICVNLEDTQIDFLLYTSTEIRAETDVIKEKIESIQDRITWVKTIDDDADIMDYVDCIINRISWMEQSLEGFYELSDLMRAKYVDMNTPIVYGPNPDSPFSSGLPTDVID